MPNRRWFRPPHHLLALFVTLTVLPGLALAWLGWRLLEQDRALADQRILEKLETDATRIAADLREWLAGLRLSLVQSPNAFEPEPLVGAVAVEFRSEGVSVNPAGRLRYLPNAATSPEVDNTVYDSAEALEFREHDLTGALAAYSELTTDESAAVRAGALLRIARVQRKLGRHSAALQTYAELTAIDDVALSGVPVTLLASQARLSELETLGRGAELASAARSLAGDISEARWRLDRDSFRFFAAATAKYVDPSAFAGESGYLPSEVALEEAVAEVHRLWRSGELAAESLPATIDVGDESVLVVAVAAGGDDETLKVFLATAEHLQARWSDTWDDAGVAVELFETGGTSILAGSAAPAAERITLTSVDTGLPWSMRVGLLDPGSALAELDGRRTLLLSGMTMAMLLVFGGGYFAARALMRELAIAQLQGDFVSAVSHEFRSPLTSMRHIAELLAAGKVTSDERRAQYYGILTSETSRLHRLVENLLDFRRLESGAFEYRFENVDIEAQAAEIVDEFERLASGDHSVELSAEQGLPSIWVDREALSRALWNLLDNASKYSPAGTPIRLHIARHADKVRLTVRDCGQGIASPDFDRIFDKFVRGDSEESRRIEGAGIGLTMVREIARVHGGQVTVESTVGAGSAFTIELPIKGPPQ